MAGGLAVNVRRRRALSFPFLSFDVPISNVAIFWNNSPEFTNRSYTNSLQSYSRICGCSTCFCKLIPLIHSHTHTLTILGFVGRLTRGAHVFVGVSQ